MFEYLQNWLHNVESDYGVNPQIFAVIYFAGVIPFWLSLYKIIAGIKHRKTAQVRTFSIILGVIIIAPFSYVAFFGRNVPLWFWIVAVVVIAYSSYSVFARIRSSRAGENR